MKIAVIDNYDSFIQTILYYLRSIDDIEFFVMKNNQIDSAIIEHCDRLLLSPGPGIPSEAGQLMQIIDQYHRTHPILGICLGHQALYEYFGGTLLNIHPPMHGEATPLIATQSHYLWEHMEIPMEIAHYHSWVADPSTQPNEITLIGVDDKNRIMAFEHRNLPILGIQFHPESIITHQGKQLFINWLSKENAND